MLSAGILGSGFGAYGHLPAIIRYNKYERICCLEDFKKFIISRKELREFADRLTAYPSVEEVLISTDHLFYARRPSDQEDFILSGLSDKNFCHIFFEKPLATNPHASKSCLNSLRNKDQYFSINYLIAMLPWWDFNSQSSYFSISWHFMAHHFKPNSRYTWKQDHMAGGGAIRFYGIHLIALASRFHFNHVIHSFSNKDYTYWSCILSNSKGQRLLIDINTRDEEELFLFKQEESIAMRSSSPFSDDKSVEDKRTGIMNSQDVRARFIFDYIGRVMQCEYYPLDHEDILMLWSEVEARTQLINI